MGAPALFAIVLGCTDEFPCNTDEVMSNVGNCYTYDELRDTECSENPWHTTNIYSPDGMSTVPIWPEFETDDSDAHTANSFTLMEVWIINDAKCHGLRLTAISMELELSGQDTAPWLFSLASELEDRVNVSYQDTDGIEEASVTIVSDTSSQIEWISEFINFSVPEQGARWLTVRLDLGGLDRDEQDAVRLMLQTPLRYYGHDDLDTYPYEIIEIASLPVRGNWIDVD